MPNSGITLMFNETDNIQRIFLDFARNFLYMDKCIYYDISSGGASGVMVIIAGIGHGNTSSNPGLIAFHIALIPLGKV